MSTITIAGTTLQPTRLVKLDPANDLPARDLAKGNGADDLFIKVGGDTYVATGRGLPLSGVKKGTAVKVGERYGVVTAVDAQLNSAGEGARIGLWTAAGTFVVSFPLILFISLLGSPALLPLGAVIATSLVLTALGGLLGGAAGALFGAKRPVDTDTFEQLGKSV
ncbi:MAG: hypothetical protein FJZ01_02225 [Candidatus Sericytochromatia bacterium]|nr:hypothetical protein [Candidatus Tanganyikabacteria bacterium]